MARVAEANGLKAGSGDAPLAFLDAIPTREVTHLARLLAEHAAEPIGQRDMTKAATFRAAARIARDHPIRCTDGSLPPVLTRALAGQTPPLLESEFIASNAINSVTIAGHGAVDLVKDNAAVVVAAMKAVRGSRLVVSVGPLTGRALPTHDEVMALAACDR